MTSTLIADDQVTTLGFRDADKVLPVDAARPEWLEARRKGLGASDMSTIAGVNRFSSLYELWLDKTGRAGELEPTMVMRMGNMLEPVVRQLFTEESAVGVKACGLLRSKLWPWLQYTPDGITTDGGLFEAKTTNWRMADEWADGQVADHAEIQVQAGMAVTGIKHAWVAALIDGREFVYQRVERDDDLIAGLVEMGSRFWTDHVLADVAPPITGQALEALKDEYAVVERDREIVTADQAHPFVDAYRAAHEAEKAAKADKDTAAANLRKLLGDAELLETPDGRTLATCKQITTRRLDQQLLKAAGINVDEYKTASTSRRLNIPKEGK